MQEVRSLSNRFFDRLRGGRPLLRFSYTSFNMISIVSSMGTLVNKDSTSIEAKIPSGFFPLKISRNPSTELSRYFPGIYGFSSWLSLLANLYVGVFT